MIKSFIGEILNNKRKKIAIIGITAVALGFIGGMYTYTKANSISEKLIRFHVIANSDTNIDQGVKMKVKDEIIKHIQPKLKESKSKNESKKILEENKETIVNIANEVLRENGQPYTASAEIGRFDFPVKSYGNVVLPSGEYEALRVVLGTGEGKNWWCVMFPPLCFVDVKNAVADKEMESAMKDSLTDKEIEKITQENAPKIKFKSAEVLNNIFGK